MSAERETIHLEQFLKVQGMVGTGGQAKLLIQAGQVFVNGQVETRRKRQLVHGDKVTCDQRTVPVHFDESP